jgi:cell division protein ZapA
MDNRDKQIQGAIVEIFGDEYRISGEADVVQIQKVARYVDQKMREVEEQSGRLSKANLAVLVAMEITAELFQAQGEREELVQKAYDNIDRLNQLIEQRSTLVPMTSEWVESRLSKNASV